MIKVLHGLMVTGLLAESKARLLNSKIRELEKLPSINNPIARSFCLLVLSMGVKDAISCFNSCIEDVYLDNRLPSPIKDINVLTSDTVKHIILLQKERLTVQLVSALADEYMGLRKLGSDHIYIERSYKV